MKKILIVEDSNMFVNLLRNRVTKDFQIESTVCQSYQETAELFAQGENDFLLSILDLTLPGSDDGEIVDLVISQGIPVIVVTGRMNDQIREKILEKRVLDYIMKGTHTLDMLSNAISRYLRNQEVKVLIVEDSRLVRENTRAILSNQQFSVLEADNGLSALEQLRIDPSIRLVLTDYNMPKMDGFELTAEIRKNYPIDKMAIIGMSAHGNPLLSAQFLKRGANDFINKPYFEEELIWRVNQNIEMLNHIDQLREAAIKDALTGLHNRRYFFQVGEKFFANARRENLQIGIAMIDIDHFKSINDTYGHSTGDQVIQQVAKILQQSFRTSDIVARLGGEEFVVLTSNMDSGICFAHFDNVREKIASKIIDQHGQQIRVSVSMGLCNQLAETLDKTVSKADELLYQAKKAGRNCIIASN